MPRLRGQVPLLWVLLALPLLAAASPAATVLYRFTGGADGGAPEGPLLADSAGNLYGTTQSGGLGYGVVFRLAPPAVHGGSWTESVLYAFTDADDATPTSGLALDARGNLYGTTIGSGSVVFRLSPDPTAGNGRWVYAVLYRLNTTAALPNAVTVGDDGNLYGTAYYGGDDNPYGSGLVYRLSPPAQPDSTWSFAALHSFAGYPTDGAYPAGAVILDAQGNIYGTTSEGGTGRCFSAGTFIGCGTVFMLSPTSAGWVASTLYDFNARENNAPFAGLVPAPDGALYGTATYTAFRLARAGTSKWRKQDIYQFTEGISGTIPDGVLARDAHGNLYGTSSSSGLSGFSTAFRLTPPTTATAGWRETTLANFGQGLATGQPSGGLVFGAFGALYGITSANTLGDYGTVFEVAR